MTIEQLQYFMAIAKLKNFSTAAEECFISQSSLSKQIKALEQELGRVELFDRNTKKLEITYAGKEFYISAEKILSEYQKMMNTMKKYEQGHTEVLNVGTIPVMNHYGLTDMFFGFQEYYTNIRLRVTEANSVPIIEEFTKRKIDIAFLRNNYLPIGDFKTYPLVDDQLVLVTNYANWLAKYDKIDLKEAENEKFLFLGNNTGMYESCRQACSRAGFVPREQVLDVRSSTIKNLVANGQGVSLMMYQSIKYMDDPRIKIIHLEEPCSINLTLIVRKDAMTDAVSAFIEYVTDSFDKL
ncbi:MAG: LysR family transcriptional regulator [Lachnospiraceae bacterium]